MEIEIINKDAETTLAIKYDAVNFTNMGNIMGEGFQKIFDYLKECGKSPSGVPYCKYTNGSADFMTFDIELGIPVSEIIPEKGEFFISKTYEGKAITAVHKGAYKDIEKTYGPMMQYLVENKLESNNVYYDYYLNSPVDTPESELLTKVVFPIK